MRMTASRSHICCPASPRRRLPPGRVAAQIVSSSYAAAAYLQSVGFGDTLQPGKKVRRLRRLRREAHAQGVLQRMTRKAPAAITALSNASRHALAGPVNAA